MSVALTLVFAAFVEPVNADIGWGRHSHRAETALEAAIDARDARAALLEVGGADDALLPCLELFLLEAQLAEDDPSHAAQEIALDAALGADEYVRVETILLRFARAGLRLARAYERCGEPTSDARRATVQSLQQDFARAEETSLAALRASNEMQDALRAEYLRLKEALGEGIDGSWARVDATYARNLTLQLPHRRTTPIPVFTTGVLIVGLGISSLISMIDPFTDGRSLRGYPAASWGLTMGLVGAIPAALTWLRPRVGMFLFSALTFTGTVALASFEYAQDTAARRSFAAGLWSGAAINLALTVGALIRNRARRRRVSVAPVAIEGGAVFNARGAF
ncbi:MAG: hypothetical protein AAF411_10555 [Myxococcota bacterium]